MTRIAIVAASEALRSELAAALRASPSFDVVAVGGSVEGLAAASADVVLLARDAQRASRPVRATEPMAPPSHDQPALTNRERDVLALLASGLGNKQIAARLGISTSTVKTHLELLFEKLEVTTRTEAVATAVRLGLLFL